VDARCFAQYIAARNAADGLGIQAQTVSRIRLRASQPVYYIVHQASILKSDTQAESWL